MYFIQTILTPALFPYYKNEGRRICVITDVLRATTTICTAVHWGAEIIPVKEVEKAKEMKAKGYLVAGERIEEKLDFADFGNSALLFRTDKIRGKEIVHSTTNGTRAVEMAVESNADTILAGSFVNLSSLASFIAHNPEDVSIFCSGWKNTFCLEDTLFAGALAEKVMENNSDFITKDDATNAAIDLWHTAQKEKDLLTYLQKASHIHRLRKHQMDDVFEYTFTVDAVSSVPVLKDGKFVRAE